MHAPELPRIWRLASRGPIVNGANRDGGPGMKTRNRLLLWSASAACGLLAGCASGGSPFAGASDTELIFITAAQTWDINKDNVVTCDEWKQYTTQFFHEADADRDGVLTPEEFRAISAQDKLFAVADHGYFDQNGDGKVTLAEFTEKPNPAFKRLDRNNDCQLASDEFARQFMVKADPQRDPTDNTLPRTR